MVLPLIPSNNSCIQCSNIQLCDDCHYCFCFYLLLTVQHWTDSVRCIIVCKVVQTFKWGVSYTDIILCGYILRVYCIVITTSKLLHIILCARVQHMKSWYHISTVDWLRIVHAWLHTASPEMKWHNFNDITYSLIWIHQLEGCYTILIFLNLSVECISKY